MSLSYNRMPNTNIWVSELQQIFRLAAPIMVTNALTFLLNVEDQMFLGHLGTVELAGAAIGNTIFNMIWYFLFGSSTAVDTLVSQAYGIGDVEKVNFWTKQGYASLALLNIPGAILLYCSPWIATNILRQEPEISHLAGVYCRVMIPGMFFLSMFTVLEKAQQAQNNLTPSVCVAGIANVFNVLGNYMFIWVLGLGFIGSPIATSLCRLLSFVMLVLLSWYFPPKPPDASVIAKNKAMPNYGTIDRSSEHDLVKANSFGYMCRGLKQFFSLGIPGGCMMLFESWSFLIVTVEAGMLGVTVCAASQVMAAYNALVFFTFGAAIGSAGTIRVGNLCGAQKPVEAKAAASVCITLGSAMMLCLGMTTFFGRFLLGPTFSNDPQVWDILAHLAPLAAVLALFDGFQANCSSVLRAIGRQSQCAIIYGIGFWVFGVPGGALLCFWFAMGVYGLWWGIVSGLFGVSMLSIFFVLRVDWVHEAEKAWEATQVPSLSKRKPFDA